MTDQIYYKIQYPVKKAINIIKNIDPEDPFQGEENFSDNIEQISSFLEMWEKEGENSLKELIKKLRQVQ